MTPEQWQATKTLFAQALEQPTDDRARFIAVACGDDQVLLREVSSLLRAHDQDNHVLENGFDLASSVKGRQYTGRVFGSYRIIREIGRGGMGAVFLAERDDHAYRQQVAIKIIQRSIVDPKLEERFHRERKILALLNHPNIAHLLDGGVNEDGDSYFVMEYVEGEPLLSFVERNNLSIKDRLQLFLKVCSAVAFAHRNLVVHRDLKPQNILIKSDGEPKLLDFGIAKIVDKGVTDFDQTATAFRAFTPSYASPEQIRGRSITTASDVYSLGVLLYELLTGERPFKTADKSLEEVLREVCESEPTRPSSVLVKQQSSPRNASVLRGDLDNIVLKALRKEPERRYSSVELFAQDIERHLKHLPVAARPNTIKYRASRFLSRNKVSVAAAALVVAALLAGLTIALWQARIARAERDRAEARFNDVRKLSNSLLFEITPKIERLQGSTEARELLVKRALEYLNRLGKEAQADPQLQSELASAFEKIGDLQGNPNKPNLSDFAGAIESYKQANAIRRALPPTDENQNLLAQNFRELAAIRFIQNDHQGSLKDFEEAIRIYEQLRVRDAASVELRVAFVETQINYAQTYSSNNQYAIAIPLFQKVLSELDGMDSTLRETRTLKIRTDAFLGNALSWNGQQAEAELEIAKAIDGAKSLINDYPNDPPTLQAAWRVYILASSIYEGTNDEASLRFAEQAYQVAQVSSATDPADTQATHNLAKTYSRIGILSISLGRQAEGIVNLERSEKILLELSKREPKNLAYQNDLGKLYTRFGDAREKQKDLPGALRAFQQSTDLFSKIAAIDEKNLLAQRDLAQALKSLGKTYVELRETRKAKEVLEQAMSILNRLKAQNALGGFDQKLMAEVQTALEQL